MPTIYKANKKKYDCIPNEPIQISVLLPSQIKQEKNLENFRNTIQQLNHRVGVEDLTDNDIDEFQEILACDEGNDSDIDDELHGAQLRTW